MRSIAAGSYRRICDAEHLWKAWRQVRRGKRRGPQVASFELDADRHILRLARTLEAGLYRPGAVTLRTVRDPKLRLIAAPSVADRIVHRALLDVIGPTFERAYLAQCYTRGPGAGVHHAVLAFLGQLRRYRWRQHLDIARYFPSVELGRLEALMFRRLRDRDTQELLSLLLDAGARVYRTAPARAILGPPGSGRRGLCLGSYLSQWCGNFYLNDLDHYLKRQLKVPGYLRYMDDFVLYLDDREELVESAAAIGRWLWETRRLALNPKHGQVRPSREPATFLGYRVSQAGITASRKLRRRFAARVKQAARKGEAELERCLAAYRGLLLFR